VLGTDDIEAIIAWSSIPFTTASIEEGTNVYSEARYVSKQWKTDGCTMFLFTGLKPVLIIFENTKQCLDEHIIELYTDYWSTQKVRSARKDYG
jgi:hypothetical protein